jgi:hypothetical protein
MSDTELIVDELSVSTHTNSRTQRDFATHVNGSSLTGEQYVSAFIRTRDSGDARLRFADLTVIYRERGREWHDECSRTIYSVRLVPATFSSRLMRQCEEFVRWVEQERR